MLRKSARVLILLVLIELGFLALLIVSFGLPPALVVGFVVGGTALGVLLSLRRIGRIVGPSRGRHSASQPTTSSAPDGAISSVPDGAMRAIAGLLLAFPGVLTGVAGLVLLIPAVRQVLKPILWAQFSRLLPVEVGAVAQGFGSGASFEDLFGQTSGPNPFGSGRGRGQSDRINVVDVDVASTDPDSSGNPSSAPPELR